MNMKLTSDATATRIESSRDVLGEGINSGS